MTTYTGTQQVTPGLYLNLKRRTMEHVEKDGALPGVDTDRYYRVPMLLWLAVAPLLGLAFVIFLPFIGFAMVGRLTGDKLRQAFHAIAANGRFTRSASERDRNAR